MARSYTPATSMARRPSSTASAVPRTRYPASRALAMVARMAGRSSRTARRMLTDNVGDEYSNEETREDGKGHDSYNEVERDDYGDEESREDGVGRAHRDCMQVRGALCDLTRALGDAATQLAGACVRNGECYDERHCDIKMGLLQGEGDEAEWLDTMCALELITIVQRLHDDHVRIPNARRCDRGGRGRRATWSPDSFGAPVCVGWRDLQLPASLSPWRSWDGCRGRRFHDQRRAS